MQEKKFEIILIYLIVTEFSYLHVKFNFKSLIVLVALVQFAFPFLSKRYAVRDHTIISLLRRNYYYYFSLLIRY